jgi:predicted nucleic acid-binding protein
LIVLDASAAVEWLLRSRAGIDIDGWILSHADTLHAPHLLDIEVTHTLRRHVRARYITVRRAEEALSDLAGAPCIRHPHYPLLRRIWELRDSLSAYDATYVALAETLDAPLITCDSKLAAAHGHHARIELVP